MPRPILGKQRKVALLGVANGLSVEEIAKAMFVTRSTVETHLAHVRRVLGVHTRAHAVARALKLGAIKPTQIVDDGECPGYETNPNYCKCSCTGCKYNCAAHNPVTEEPDSVNPE